MAQGTLKALVDALVTKGVFTPEEAVELGGTDVNPPEEAPEGGTK